jgi:hypothetical protein
MNQPVCKSCGQIVTGKYFEALGAAWHLEHFRCAECHQPILESKFAEHEGLPYHITCYELKFLPHCTYCGKPLRVYGEDEWGAKFCPEHRADFPACRYCGRLIPTMGKEAMEQDSGVPRCKICQRSAVESLQRAQPLFSLIFQWISRQGLMFDGANVRLGLYNMEELKAFKNNEADTAKTLGTTKIHSIVQDGAVVNREINIAIFRGLPSTLFQGVAVHEFAHAWLTIHGITDLAKPEEEGFCELLCHRYYLNHRTVESTFYARQIEMANDPIYGAGFRQLKELADRLGFQVLIKTLDSTKQLPVNS